MKIRSLLTICCVLSLNALFATAQTKIAPTPPMGWNSWNHFNSRVTDADVRSAADNLVSSGMRDAGYVYVNIDDAWQGKRDAAGVIQANEKFPNMKALGDYIHSKGLKFGIYSSPGRQTCAHYEGSLDHEEQDAKAYAAWGVDYLKYDLCSFRENMSAARKAHPEDPQIANRMMHDSYTKMWKYLQASGRPIVFSLCQYGFDDVWKWGESVGGNAWRTTGDIEDNYASMSKIGFGQLGLAKYAGPGHWNDPDMLEVGNGGMTEDEYKSHFSLWAILASPLLAGNDLSKMSAADKAILMNADVIKVNQDSLGKQGDRLSAKGETEIWSRPLASDGFAVGLFNRTDHAQEMTLDMASLGVTGSPKVRDLWLHKDLDAKSPSFTASVPPHGVVMLRVSK